MAVDSCESMTSTEAACCRSSEEKPAMLQLPNGAHLEHESAMLNEARKNSFHSKLLQMPPKFKIDVAFENISYSVTCGLMSKKRKEILKGVSGLFKSGELTAIMGPSGAGKSSLLNVLSGFIKGGVEGSIRANDKALDDKYSIKNHSAYILQDDFLNPLFTVTEIMSHAANLKLSSWTSRKSKRLLIEDILDSMALQDAASTRCNKLSGGQKKRLNVCLELINNPSVIYLDEPTSGLDMSSCSLLIAKLKGLAKSGRTVICTIHQPSAPIFMQMDHLYIVSSGHAVYQGSPSNVLPFLDNLGFVCPQFHNPADFAMDVVSGEFGNFTDQLLAASNNNDWRNQVSHKTSDKDGNELMKRVKKRTISQSSDSSPSELSRYFYLVGKICKQLHRDWMLSYMRLCLHIVVSVLLGLLFRGIGNNGAKVFSNVSYFFVSILYISFTSMMPAALKFPCELEVLKKEHFNNWFKFTTFFFAFISVHLPVQVLFCMTFCGVSYVMSAQVLEVSRILLYGVAMSFNTVISELIGLGMGTMATPVNGVFNSSILLAFLSLLGGFLVFFKDYPPFMDLFTFAGFFRYVFEIMVVAQYGFKRGRLECPKEEIYCHFRQSEAITEQMLGMHEDNMLLDIGLLVIYTAVIGMITFVRVRYRIKTFH